MRTLRASIVAAAIVASSILTTFATGAARAQEQGLPEMPRPVPQAPEDPPRAEEPVPLPDETAPPETPTPRTLPTVLSIRVEGERRYTESQLLAALGLKVGESYAPDVAQKGLDVLWNAFSVKARILAREAPGGVDLVLEVEEMNADLEPRFVGNKEIKTATLRRWALLEERGELFLYQAERVRARLLEGYRKEGYAFAEVDVVRRGAESGPVSPDELPDVIFEIREGPQVRVKDVVVHGSATMPDTGMWWWKDGLQELAEIELGGPWLLNWFGDKFVRETLDADIVAMREVYRDRGFLDAVVELERLEFSADREGVVIHIAVDEGQPYTVSGLHIVGVERTYDPARREYDEKPAPLLFPEEELLALCQQQPGVRYERARERADGSKLRDHYGERGYLAHPSLVSDYFEFLEPQLVFDPDARTVDVTYRLAQGRKRWVREVIFSGARHTRDRVLRRQIDMLPGEVADLTKIRAGLQHLYSTRHFTSEGPDLGHRDPTFAFKATGDPDWTDVEYTVEEGKVVDVQMQALVSSDDGLGGRFVLFLRNFDVADPPTSVWSTFGELFGKEAFHGAGQELELELSPGTRVNSYHVRFFDPDIFRTHFDPWNLDLQLSSRERRQIFYDEERVERRVRFGRQFGRHLAAFVGYTNQTLDVTDLDAPLTGFNDPVVLPLPDSIYQQEGRTDLVGLTFDLRYRKTDHFLNPRSGMRWGWQSGVFGGAIGGDYEFVKSSVEADWFWPVGDELSEVRPSFHLGLGGGIADAFGDTSLVPYTERFFLGGVSTLRGFERRGVGPNRGDNALGGETYLAGTLEYRIPLHSITEPGSYKQTETFRLTLFTDAGLLGVDPWDVDPDEIRWTYGIGLGMVHPFPITINFGFPLRSGEGDRERVFSFTILNLWF